MKGKDYFIIGCKLLGIYCIALSVPGLLDFIQSVVRNIKVLENIKTVFSLAAPFLIYAASGTYLLAGGETIYRLTYPGEEQGLETSPEQFNLCLKVLGLWMVANSLPDFLKTLVGMGMGAVVPAYLNEVSPYRYLIITILSQVWGLFFGLYLIKDGRYLVDLAYKSSNSK